MVNYHDPATIAQEYLGVVKLWHVVNGMFIWEFVTTLDFEWDFIRGRRPYRWTIWVCGLFGVSSLPTTTEIRYLVRYKVYSIARLAAILSVILNMIVFDTTTPINCQVWVTFAVLFAELAFAAASLLIVLRVTAIWNRAKIIFAISMTVWMADVAILLYCLVQVRSTWSPEANACVISQFNRTKPSIVSSLVSDLTLLFTMLFGLLRLRLETGCAFGMVRVLWKQGLIWLLLATVAEVPSTVLLLLDLNVPLDLMTQTPSMIMVTVAATRIHRGLVNFVSSDVLHDISGSTGLALSDMRARSGPIPLNRMEVTVHTEYEQYGTLQTTRYASTDTQGRYKAQEVIRKGDKESGIDE